MRGVKLKPFQELAVERLEDLVAISGRRYAEKEEPQAIVLSAPTGAGKTIIAAALIESLLKRGTRAPAILWISDNPMLNEQSCYRIGSVSEIPHTHLVIGDHTNLTGEDLLGGRVYFLNTQKLGKSTLLTKKGDARAHHIWQMIQNTIEGASKGIPPLCIIDEAHRGLRDSATNGKNGKQSIASRFIDGASRVGDPEIRLSPMPVILGISATPQHFQEHLGRHGRALHSVSISPGDVRDSGLLKERILVHGTSGEGDDAPYTMLQQGCIEYRRIAEKWGPEGVSPLLVVQVEDKSEEKSKGTDLDRVMSALRSDLPEVTEAPGAVAHCFSDKGEMSLEGIRVRPIELVRIQEDRDVKIVLFKTALSTGWDCPRAEILVSWRGLQDNTAIAQLVGRMLRTPLARHMRRDGLDDVSLYVPRYDDEVLNSIKDWLETEGSQGFSELEKGDSIRQVFLREDEAAKRAAATFSELPTYRCTSGRGRSHLARLNAMCDSLSAHGIGDGVQEDVAKKIANAVSVWLDRGKNKKILEGLASTEIRIGSIDPFSRGLMGAGSATDGESITVEVPTASIDFILLYARARRRIGERNSAAIRRRLLAANNFVNSERDAKYAILRMAGQKSLLDDLDAAASEILTDILHEHRQAMDEADPEIRRHALAHAMEPIRSTEVLPLELRLPLPASVSSVEAAMFKKSLYLTEEGTFPCALNPWEKTALKKDDHTLWLRNQPRAIWALAVPLPAVPGQSRGLHYPDFVTFKDNGPDQRPTVSVIEPHSNQFGDLLPKAKGLAKYAEDHAGEVDRVLMTQGEGADYTVLPLHDPELRRKVRDLSDSPDGERELKRLYR